MCETVEGSETPDEVHGVYADHRTVAKKVPEGAQGDVSGTHGSAAGPRWTGAGVQET